MGLDREKPRERPQTPPPFGHQVEEDLNMEVDLDVIDALDDLVRNVNDHNVAFFDIFGVPDYGFGPGEQSGSDTDEDTSENEAPGLIPPDHGEDEQPENLTPPPASPDSSNSGGEDAAWFSDIEEDEEIEGDSESEEEWNLYDPAGAEYDLYVEWEDWQGENETEAVEEVDVETEGGSDRAVDLQEQTGAAFEGQGEAECQSFTIAAVEAKDESLPEEEEEERHEEEEREIRIDHDNERIYRFLPPRSLSRERALLLRHQRENGLMFLGFFIFIVTITVFFLFAFLLFLYIEWWEWILENFGPYDWRKY